MAKKRTADRRGDDGRLWEVIVSLGIVERVEVFVTENKDMINVESSSHKDCWKEFGIM